MRPQKLSFFLTFLKPFLLLNPYDTMIHYAKKGVNMLSKKFFFSIIIFFLSLNPAYADNLKDAVLMKTTDKNAVCNNGEQSTFVLSKSNSKNWFVYFQGGGVAFDLNIFLKR